MEQKRPPELKKLDEMLFSKHWKITLRVFGITVSVIAACALTGYAFDQLFDTSPVGLIVGVVAAYPVAQIVVYKVFKRITQ